MPRSGSTVRSQRITSRVRPTAVLTIVFGRRRVRDDGNEHADREPDEARGWCGRRITPLLPSRTPAPRIEADDRRGGGERSTEPSASNASACRSAPGPAVARQLPECLDIDETVFRPGNIARTGRLGSTTSRHRHRVRPSPARSAVRTSTHAQPPTRVNSHRGGPMVLMAVARRVV